MKDALAKFSATFSRLSSTERWFIIAVIIGVFAVINFVIVIPHLGDWGQLTNRMNVAQDTLQKYENMIGQTPQFSNQIAKLEGENAGVPPEDQAINFLTAVQNQAAQSHVTILTSTRQPERTNQFFLERAQTLTTSSQESELVDFLYNLGAGASQIRVRSLSIRPDRPDAARTALNSTLTLIASFQKKAPKRAAPAKAAAPQDSKTKPTAAAPPNKSATPAPGPTAKPATPNKK